MNMNIEYLDEHFLGKEVHIMNPICKQGIIKNISDVGIILKLTVECQANDKIDDIIFLSWNSGLIFRLIEHNVHVKCVK